MDSLNLMLSDTLRKPLGIYQNHYRIYHCRQDYAIEQVK